MAAKSTIEWTSSTWNPVTGCTKISPGCHNCYAKRMSKRLQAMGQPNYVNGFKVKTHEHALNIPIKWKKPQEIFVNSMSDLFHQDVPLKFVKKVFNIMNKADWHHYQVLTKRSERLLNLDKYLTWADHIWMGVSVETEKQMFRIDDLRQTHARIKFLSLEPLLGPLPFLDLSNINWVIVGGESGPGARPMEEKWVIDIHNQCRSTEVPFFLKQWGGVFKKKNGRTLMGKIWNEMPSLKPSKTFDAKKTSEGIRDWQSTFS